MSGPFNILVVEDDRRVADFLRRGLTAEGWSIEVSHSGEDALKHLETDKAELIVLDAMLPGISGFDVCRKLRWREDRRPILMLTALDATDDIIMGLRNGADDYLVKPFKFDELTARIDALRRRISGELARGDNSEVVRVGGLEFDIGAMVVRLNGELVPMTATERDLLQYFLQYPGQALSRQRILSAVWGDGKDPLTNIVDVYIARLRKKLAGWEAAISTVPGIGYRLDSQ